MRQAAARAGQQRALQSARVEIRMRVKRACLYHVIEVQPWSRLPERRYATDRLRAVNEPRAVAVELNESGRMTVGRPDGGRSDKLKPFSNRGRIDDEWWRQTISRSYLELLLAGGKRIVVFQEFTNRPLVHAVAMIDRPSGCPAVGPSYAELALSFRLLISRRGFAA